jgi:hypothetical protein
MRKLIALLALVFAALVVPGVASATPLTEKEMHSVGERVPALLLNGPLKSFAVGEGQGYATEYYPRTIPQLANQLEEGKGLRVSCNAIAMQLSQSLDLTLEGCAGLVASLRNDPKWSTESCNDGMFAHEGGNAITVVDNDGKRSGAYHRSCYVSETILTYDKKPGMSLVCLNVIVDVQPVLRKIAVVRKVVATPIPVAEATEAPPLCSKDLTLYAWKLESLPSFLETKAESFIMAAKDRHTLVSGFSKTYSPADAPDVSRSMGADIRNAIGVKAAEDVEVQVFFGNKNGPDRKIPSLTLTIRDGKAVSPLSPEQWNAQVIGVLWPDYLPTGRRVVSPTLTHPRNGWTEISDLGRWLFFFKSEKDPCGMVMTGLTAPTDPTGKDLRPIPGYDRLF